MYFGALSGKSFKVSATPHVTCYTLHWRWGKTLCMLVNALTLLGWPVDCKCAC
jgi:hypothetical protein